jgi:phospholipid-binding lipoprotein MlaA
MRAVRVALIVVMLGVSSGCASLPAGHVANPKDPWERYNRAVFSFNDEFDRTIFKPVSEAYRDYVPEVFQFTLRNFLGNLSDVATTVQFLLQGRPSDAGNSATRVLFNTTIGFFGLGDPASEMGFPKTRKDFGLTFGYWGAGPGPYFVFPFLGPSSVRDGIGMVLDMSTNPRDAVVEEARYRNMLTGASAIHRRIDLMGAEGTLEAIAFDRYSGIRDAYLASRRSMVYDGDPPPEPFLDE